MFSRHNPDHFEGEAAYTWQGFAGRAKFAQILLSRNTFNTSGQNTQSFDYYEARPDDAVRSTMPLQTMQPIFHW